MTKNKFIYWFRWVAVLPGALIVGILVNFPFHWMLYLTLVEGELISGVNIGSIEYNLYPLVTAITFILAGFEIAPSHKFKTAIVLTAIWLLSFFGAFIFFSSLKPQFELRSALSLMGAFLGLYICWVKSRSDLK